MRTRPYQHRHWPLRIDDESVMLHGYTNAACLDHGVATGVCSVAILTHRFFSPQTVPRSIRPPRDERSSMQGSPNDTPMQDADTEARQKQPVPPSSPRDCSAESLLPLVYAELRQLAGARLGSLRPGQTLQPTALVHEAYLRLVKDGDPGWNGRGHFFGAAARAMRNILVERARSKSRLKRGGGAHRVDLVDVSVASEPDDAERTIELDRLLDVLEREHPRLAELAMLHLFVGMTHAEIAHALGLSVRTVERDWRFARALMQRALQPNM